MNPHLRARFKGDIFGTSKECKFELVTEAEDGTETTVDLSNYVMEFEFPRTQVGSLSKASVTLLLPDVEIETLIDEIVGLEFKPRRFKRLRRLYEVTTTGKSARRWVAS